MDGVKKMLIALIEGALVGFDNQIVQSGDVLTGSIGSWDVLTELSTTVLKPFCLTLIGLCLMVEVATMLQRVEIKLEQGLKIALKIVLAYVALDITPTLMLAIYSQTALWITGAAAHSIGDAANNGTYITEIIGGIAGGLKGMFTILGLLVSTFIVVLAVKVCGLLIVVVAYGRMFELYVYIAVSPLPVAFMPLSGEGGLASRVTVSFFKSFAAVCLQGLVMVVCMKVFTVVLAEAIKKAADTAAAAQVAGGDASAAVTELIFSMLLGTVVLVLSVFKSGGWSKQILGVA